jgi:hypothetical protein
MWQIRSHHRLGTRAVADAEGKEVEFVEIERFKFYEDAKKAFAVVSTGETAFYANLILKKVRQRAQGGISWLQSLRPRNEGAGFRHSGRMAYDGSQSASAVRLRLQVVRATATAPQINRFRTPHPMQGIIGDSGS